MDRIANKEAILAIITDRIASVKDLSAYRLLFVTSCVAGIGVILSKFILDGSTVNDLLTKIVICFELLALLLSLGNAMGSYTSVWRLAEKMVEFKTKVMLMDGVDDPGAVLADYDKAIGQLSTEQQKFYAQSYVTFGVGIVVGALYVAFRIWFR